MSKRDKFSLVFRTPTDAEIAMERMKHLGITPMPRAALANGRPAPKLAPVEKETAMRCLAWHMATAMRSGALR